ncbi:hypothetical protein OROMI_024355 [Orobanche minor]
MNGHHEYGYTTAVSVSHTVTAATQRRRRSTPAVDEAYINGVHDGLNLRSLLARSPFYPPLDASNLLSIPITEQLFTTHDAVLPPESRPFGFFSEPAMFSFNHSKKLPDLLSLDTAVGTEPKFPMDGRFTDARMPRQQRRHRVVSEKARRLQKLLPLDKKMDTASVLEETHKYIRFLEAQVSVLQSMPEEDCDWETRGGGSRSTATESGVMVNSPAAQKLLYYNGCCIYSLEQLALLKKNARFHQTPEMETKYKETSISLSSLIREKEAMVRHFNEEAAAHNDFQRISQDRDRVMLELEKRGNKLNQEEKEHGEREAQNEHENIKVIDEQQQD